MVCQEWICLAMHDLRTSPVTWLRPKDRKRGVSRHRACKTHGHRTVQGRGLIARLRGRDAS